MASKTKQATKPYEGPVFDVGTPVVIIRPNPLWSGCAGEVVSIANGIHRIKIQGRNGDTFHADCPCEQLRIDL